MRLALDRRAFIAASAAGLLLPVRPALAGLWPAAGFTHGVASGDPGPDSIRLWTRYASADGRDAVLKVEVARDPGMMDVIARAETVAGPSSWGTAQAHIKGLPVGGWLFYRFTAPDGSQSVTGRTRTLPRGPLSRFNIAVVSCSNKPFGHFNGYAHLAARNDIDLIVHLGDYIYEYQQGAYPSAAQALAGRVIEPAHEIVALDDYRQRYASYRVDPALQELHRNFPMIAIWDDHEICNDSWKAGAENHQAGEGDYEVRKAAATRAHKEWLPQADRMWQRYDIGDLLSLITVDTRIAGRDQQLELGPVLREGATAVARFRDGPLADPARQLLGAEQEAWLFETMKASVKDGHKWQLLAQQVIMGNVYTPKNAMDFVPAGADKRLQGYVQAGMAASAAGISAAMDMWAGYPAARARLLGAAQAAGAELIVLAGDSHNAWAFDLAHDGKPAAVEFDVQSITSPGYEQAFAANPGGVRDAVVAASPELKWCDTSQRGYMTVTLTPEEARAEWTFMRTIREVSTQTTGTQVATTRRGTHRLSLG
ncbi:MAG: alkaline phosphatase D family protein [Polymorphobacter sp.]|uniref:alkaline phosphatase D family protein n=1 Tax=Polymorphobacter sp. TaxID=1909290 RepID=UPI003A86C301